MRRISLTGLLACAACGWAAQPDYFPLQVGNQWVLETASPARELLNIEVLRARVRGGATYFLVSGYAPEARWIRQAEDGTLYALDEASGQETVLARLAAGAQEYQTSLGGCGQTAQPAAGPAPYRSPQFEIDAALAVSYAPDGCRDVGLTGEVYAPGTGPLRRSLTTFAGELVFDLVWARVNGAPVLGKSREIVLTSDFRNGSKAWLAGYSDYHVATDDLRMLAELRPLPDEVDASGSGFYIQGMNRSDDLFMYLKKQVTRDEGLESNQAYRVAFDIRFASDAPTGCVGAGGAPGESVYLKAGASAEEPLALLDGTGNIQISVDKGQQSAGGKQAGVVGTIANGTSCEGTVQPYVSVRKQYAHPEAVATGERGSLWLLTGTDSAYEGLTGLYYQSVTVRINPSVEPAGGQ
jgi:hypothetical protein